MLTELTVASMVLITLVWGVVAYTLLTNVS
jgi:negative regulator of sigma E activity